MNRIRLAIAVVILKTVRVLLRANARLIGPPEPVHGPVTPPPASARELLGALFPAPTFESITVAIARFSKERAPNERTEFLAFALYIRGLAAAIAPSLARFEAATTPPPTAPDAGPVN